ncbi:MAG: 4Fe-4S dicluster domain-containing protein [Phycisphaerales bacterium]|nr:4Fe-4S dicluster domain-containing protein [Phycisphaerales bacterium]
MTVLLLVSLGAFARTARRRWQLLRVGAPVRRWDRIGERLAATWGYAFAQKRMRRYPLAGVAHMFIFLGFVVLLLRSLILFSRGFVPDSNLMFFDPAGSIGAVYALLKDVFVVLVMLGTLVFFYYRLIVRLPRLSKGAEGVIILGIIFVMMLADVLYDGAWMNLAARQTGGQTDFHGWEPVGSSAAVLMRGMSEGTLTALAHAGFWTHTSLVLIFLNLLPRSKHFHIITAVPNVFAQSLDPVGRLSTIEDIEGKLEREETLGIRRINQFSWKSILDFYTCTECGRCSDHCPATNTGKKLSPKHLTLDLRNFLYQHESSLITGSSGEALESPPEHAKDLAGVVIDPEVLWACTTCRACETECPVFITYVDKIVDMRRYLVQERGEFPAQWQTAFRSLESSANPWGFSPDDRGKWADGLDVPLIGDKPTAEYLFWVGCAPSFDERAKKTARATAQLMLAAGVDFAVLGSQEQCTGDPARRAGNEFLFQTLAQANCETLNGHAVRKIVTTCPHCFNTLANEYSDFGGKFEVIHHSVLLDQLVREGRLKPVNRLDQRVVYHDSCYLGRYNEVYDPPRSVLASIPGVTLVEALESRDRGMCCGAGGAQMFKEEEPGDERVNRRRTDQLLTTTPDVISSACPFCMRMLTDGLADRNRNDVVQLDVAEILWNAIQTDGRAG